MQTTFAFKGVGKNWAGPFFPHPDKIKHQPCAGGYLGGEKLGWSIFPHPINHMHNSSSPSDNLVHKVDVKPCQGGERVGRPSFSPPHKKQRLHMNS